MNYLLLVLCIRAFETTDGLRFLKIHEIIVLTIPAHIHNFPIFLKRDRHLPYPFLINPRESTHKLNQFLIYIFYLYLMRNSSFFHRITHIFFHNQL